jgi:hypothetical protein
MGQGRHGWLVSVVVAIAFVFASWGGAAQAQQKEEIDAIKKRVEDLEKAQKKSEWAQKLKLSGQLGLRTEFINNENFNTSEERWRQRVRIRLQATYDVNEQFMMGFRLSTGDPRFPTTGWETFGGGSSGSGTGAGATTPDGFENSSSRFRVGFDRAWITWKPTSALKLDFGKFGLPFFKPQAVWGSGIWWDDDLQPTGAAQTISLPAGGALKSLKLTLGQFLFQELRGDFDPERGSGWLGSQLSGVVAPTPAVDVSAGLGFYSFLNPHRLAQAGSSGMIVLDSGVYNNRRTNRTTHQASVPSPNCFNVFTTSCQRFVSEYQLLNLSLQGDIKTGRYPILLTADYVNNLGAHNDPRSQTGQKNQAFIVGAAMGSTKDPGNWRLGYWYYYSQADSALSMFNDDDYQFTNVKSHIIDFQVRLWKGVLLQWDNYLQKFEDSQLANLQGIPAGTGCTRVGAAGPQGGCISLDDPFKWRSRISVLVNF